MYPSLAKCITPGCMHAKSVHSAARPMTILQLMHTFLTCQGWLSRLSIKMLYGGECPHTLMSQEVQSWRQLRFWRVVPGKSTWV